MTTPDQPARTFSDYYRHHRETYWRPEVIRVGALPVWVLHNLDGWSVNSILVEGPEALLLFDTGLGRRHGEAIAREVARLSDKPVRAIVYSHHHPDHCQGTDAIVDPAAVRSGEVTVVASRLWEREYADEMRVIGPIMGVRALYQYGEMLPPEEEAYTGLGAHFAGDAVGEIVPPNRLVDDECAMDLAGIGVTVFPTGGEAASEIGLYLPEHRVAIVADEVYMAMPNLSTLRGAKFRDAMRWAAASDRVLAMDVEHLLGTHMLPVSGRDEVRRVLTTYRDAIQFTHDQAVRRIRAGATPEDLRTDLTSLPASLDAEPWTRQMYGTVAGNAAHQFTGYLGWFTGDATDLAPTPRAERSRRTLALMGGRAAVLEHARETLAGGDAQWAAELASIAVAADPADAEARRVKAVALRTLGYAEENPLRRNWYLTGALELEGTIDPSAVGAVVSAVLSNGQPPSSLLEDLRFHLDPDRVGDRRLTVAVRVTSDSASPGVEERVLAVRNGVLLVGAETPPGVAAPSATLTFTRPGLIAYVTGARTGEDLADHGMLTTEGSPADAAAFLAAFDLPPHPISFHGR